MRNTVRTVWVMNRPAIQHEKWMTATLFKHDQSVAVVFVSSAVKESATPFSLAVRGKEALGSYGEFVVPGTHARLRELK